MARTRAEDHAPPGKAARALSFPLMLGLALLFALLKLGGAAATTGFSALLCLWALAGRRQALQALSLMVVVKYLNPSLFSYGAEFGLIAWLLLILAGLRIFLTAGLRNLRAVWPVLLFCGVAGSLAAFQPNQHWDISTMKIIVFGYGAATVLVGFASLRNEEAQKLVVWLISLTATLAVLSLAVLPFRGIGYGKYSGFRGVLSHPQTLGPLLAPLTAWILAGTLFRRGSRLAGPLAAALVLLVLMILSGARTAVVTVGLSLGAASLVAVLGRKTFASFRMGRALGLSLAAVAALAAGLAVSSGLRTTLLGFVFKHHSKTLDGALASRSGGAASQWHFFLEHPLIGNGFGVYPWGEFPSGVYRVLGMPISAPVEKGFLPTAVLEEVGLLGTLAFLYLVVYLVRRVIRSGDPRWVALFFACLFVNVGEMVFFSAGGIGLYFWLLMGLCMRMGGPEPVRARRPLPRAAPARRPLSAGTAFRTAG